jgi:hypothetical protein
MTAPMPSINESPEAPAEAGKPSRPWLRWAIPAAALLVGIGIGGAVGAAADPKQSDEYQALEDRHEEAKGRIIALSDRAREATNKATTTREEAAQRQAELDQREQALAARETAVTAVEQQVAADSIESGIWTVGIDVEPGTYRVSEALSGYCYWAIYRTGTSGGDIIDNDGPTGGFPTVTLSAGQDFENSGCGTFVKQ